jgi:uncharacterized metal-binding protein
MPDLPQKKVGIVACSGEELPEGTVTRLASLRVLEQLRPGETVTICLPLFLAGGQQDRAFARFYPTIAVDGCERRCAARSTQMYSAKPAAAVVVTDFVGHDELGSARRLNEAGMETVRAVAERIAQAADELLGVKEGRRRGQPAEGAQTPQGESEDRVATCSCGSGIPVQRVQVDGQKVTLVALPLIFEQLYEQRTRADSDDMTAELMKAVKIYNPIPEQQEPAYTEAVMGAYAAFCEEKE